MPLAVALTSPVSDRTMAPIRDPAFASGNPSRLRARPDHPGYMAVTLTPEPFHFPTTGAYAVTAMEPACQILPRFDSDVIPFWTARSCPLLCSLFDYNAIA